MSTNKYNEEEDFSGKYLKSNFFVEKLIRNFFSTVEKTEADLEIQKVLEVGCGPGFSTRYLADIFEGKHFEASEFREDLVEETKKRNPGVKVAQESIYELRRENNSFDLILALEVFEHLEEPEKALREIKRVTSKYCLLSTPNEPLWRILNMARFAYLKDFGNTPGHINHWSTKAFTTFVGREFEVKKVHSPLPWNMILAERRT